MGGLHLISQSSFEGEFRLIGQLAVMDVANGLEIQALQTHPPDLPVVPHKVLVSKRLAQCLNPSLPSGVHQKTLEVYTYIFGLIKVGTV